MSSKIYVSADAVCLATDMGPVVISSSGDMGPTKVKLSLCFN